MESTLSYKLADLQADVATFLGWGRGAANGDPAFSTQQQAQLDVFTKSGIRRVYVPEAIPPAVASHAWSWLKPVGTVSLPNASTVCPLPDDFGGFEGRVVIQTTPGQSWWPIELVGVPYVYEMQGRLPTTTGRPEVACVEPLKGTQATQGQRFQLHVWPKSDQAYTLQFQYYLLPDYLTGATPYVYGGAAYTELFLESCLAVAEERLDDISDGPHRRAFLRALQAAISQDMKSKPQKLGYNDDQSDRLASPYQDRRSWYGFPGITVNGVQY